MCCAVYVRTYSCALARAMARVAHSRAIIESATHQHSFSTQSASSSLYYYGTPSRRRRSAGDDDAHTLSHQATMRGRCYTGTNAVTAVLILQLHHYLLAVPAFEISGGVGNTRPHFSRRRVHSTCCKEVGPTFMNAASRDDEEAELGEADPPHARTISTADSLKSSDGYRSGSGNGDGGGGSGNGGGGYNHRYPSRQRRLRKSLPKWFRKLLMSSKFSSMATRLREQSAGASKPSAAVPVGVGVSGDEDDSSGSSAIERQRRPLPGSRALRLILSAPLVEFKLSLLVLLSSIFVAAGTVAGLPAPIHAVMNFFEDGITVLFFLEYLLRWYCNGLRPSHLIKPLVMVDFLSILPLAKNLVTSLPFGSNVLQDHLLVNMRLLRLLRFQRFLVDYDTFERFQVATGLRFGADVRKYHLQLARVMLTIFTLLTVSSGLIYTAEHAINPAMPDIPSSLYFVITTVSTVGFGDITPVTALGRMAVCATILAGAAIIPLQVSSFVDALLDFRRDFEAKKSLSKKSVLLEEDELLYEETDALQVDGSYKRVKTNRLLVCSICDERPHREKARYCWACGSPLTLSKWGSLRVESSDTAMQ